MRIVVTREEASTIISAEEGGREFNPQPGFGYEAGIVIRVEYEEDGAESWWIRPFTRSDDQILTRAPLCRERLVELCAKGKGARPSEIVLWCD